MPRDKKTIAGRQAIIDEKRAAWQQRDAPRFELAKGVAPPAAVELRRDQGFALHAPGAFPLADEVVASANRLLDDLGHDELLARRTKGSFLTQDLLPDDLSLDSSYLRFALDDSLVAALTAYFRMVPILRTVDLWYSFHAEKEPSSSQRWHLDSDDVTQVKVWIHCSDVGPASGPLTVIDAATSEELTRVLDYDFREGHRVDDDRIDELAGAAITPLEGPAGTVHLVDTSRCFHMGSRVARGGIPRRIFVAQYLTPYSFRFRPNHLEKAPFRHLAGEGSSELERLLLGAA
jgi:hypothetical protein